MYILWLFFTSEITSRRSGAVFIVAERTKSDLAVSPTHSGVTTSNTQNNPTSNKLFPYLVYILWLFFTSEITSRRSGAVFIVAERTKSDLAVSPTHSGVTTSNTQNNPTSNKLFPYLVYILWLFFTSEITSRRIGAVFIVAERIRSDLAISPTHSGVTTSNTQNKPNKLACRIPVPRA